MAYITCLKQVGIENTFKTKTGFCHISQDKIVTTRTGLIGNIAKMTIGNNIIRLLMIYGTISTGLFYLAFKAYKKGENFQLSILGIIGLYLIYVIVNSLNNSAVMIIDRHKIKAIKFKYGIKGLTRSRFDVLFEDNNGIIKKRFIMLPGSLSGGQKATEKAIKIMEKENLLKNV